HPAGAVVAGDQRESALPTLGPLEQRPQRRQLALPAVERTLQRRRERVGELGRAQRRRLARRVERRVLREDLLLELPPRSTRPEPKLGEPGRRVAVRLGPLRLPTRAVEREHELAAGPLTVWVLGDQRLELADQLRVAAERDVGLDPLLERGQA